jgi:BirA family biotin operon repressor/biotin-[acetyl-CoA-carboxylase] ligase
MHVIKLSATASTNDDLRNYVKNMRPKQLTAMWTTNQFNGKGQGGNTWHSTPNQNLTFSLYIPDLRLPIDQSFELNKWISVSIAKWLESLNVPQVQIKWPNDILSCQKKIGGILVESSIKNNYVHPLAIGVGINVNQVHFANLPNATSIFLQTQKTFDVEALFNSCSQSLIAALATPMKGCDEAYFQRLYWYLKKGNFIQDNGPFEGVIVGVHHDGQLIIETDDNQKRMFAPKMLEFVHVADKDL